LRSSVRWETDTLVDLADRLVDIDEL
jgi:hypothetical protein